MEILKIGSRVRRKISCLTEKVDGHNVSREEDGTIIYIHPAGRFYTVEFQLAGGTIRESYHGRRAQA